MKRDTHLGQSGFSLLELSLAMSLYTVGMSAFSVLLMLSIQGTAKAETLALATRQADSLAETIIMNSDATGHVAFPDADELEQWNQALQGRSPNALSVICSDSSPMDGQMSANACSNDGQRVLKIFWDAPGTDSDPIHPRIVRLLPNTP